MGLQEKLDEVMEQAKQSVLATYQNNTEERIWKITDKVYETENSDLIEWFDASISGLERYVDQYIKSEKKPAEKIFANMKKKSYQKKAERLKLQRVKLNEFLGSYDFEMILKPDLSQRTGLSIRQLDGYTRGKDPLLEKQPDDHYRILKKKQTQLEE